MNRTRGALPLTPLLFLVGACADEHPVAPADAPASAPIHQAALVSSDCLTAPDFVVQDEAALRAALDAASPGANVAVDGVIELAGSVEIRTPGLTLGCASQGSGLRLAAGAAPPEMILILAPDVGIQGLALDGTGATQSTVAARFGIARLGAPARARITGNQVTSAAQLGVFLVGAPEPLVAQNVLVASGAGGGVHLQRQDVILPDGSAVTYRPDGARIEGNRIRQLTSSYPSASLAGIRIYDASNVSVADNAIQGGWRRGIAPTAVDGGVFVGNVIEEVLEHGIVTSLNNPQGGSFAGNTIRDNRISGAGRSAISLEAACWNTVSGNRVGAGGPGLVLLAGTGGNTAFQAGAVEDVGYRDCDGDRAADFNVVNGVSTLERHRPEVSGKDAAQCLAAPDHLVADEAGLRSALMAARPWDEIAVSGTVTVGALLEVRVPGVTLGCAAPGAGLTMASAGDPDTDWTLLWVAAPDVDIRGLHLDGAGTSEMSLYGHVLAEAPLGARRVRIVGNDVVCGPWICVLNSGSRGIVISDNRFAGDGTEFGVHVQTEVDGARVVRNEVVLGRPADAPGNPIAAGIRIAGDGASVLVADNVVRGPWYRGLHLSSVRDSDITGNVLTDSRLSGIRLSGLVGGPATVWGNRIRNNRIAETGVNAVMLSQACGNVLLGNHMEVSAAGVGAFFDVTTGLNVLTGNTVTAVDNGAYDCDGDGAVDPNILTGKGTVRKGAAPGDVIGEVMSGGKRVLR